MRDGSDGSDRSDRSKRSAEDGPDEPPAWFEALQAGPPVGFRIAGAVLTGVAVLALALAVMFEWFGWFVLTIQLWEPWGVGLGIIIFSIQIVAMFGRKREPSGSCRIPGASGDAETGAGP